MLSYLFALVVGCNDTTKEGSPNPVDIPLSVDSVKVLPERGVRSDTYLQCVPSISGADYDTLEIRYSWKNERTQEELGTNYDLYLASDTVDIDDEVRCVVLATDAGGDASENYDAVVVEQVLYPLDLALAMFDGVDAGDLMGTSLARLGDVDGDGIEEFGISSPRYSNHEIQAGKMYMLQSHEDTIDDPIRAFEGLDAKNFLGMSMVSAGFIDADVHPDLLLAATGADSNGVDSGQVYLLRFEDYWYTGSIDVDISESFQIFNGEEAGDKLGTSMLGPGDIDGDNMGDFVLSAPFHSSVGYLFGRVYLHLSTQQEPVILDGELSSGLFGIQMASPGDIDGDGLAELWVAATGGTAQKSKVYLFSGESLSDGEISIEEAQVVITATEYGTDFGKQIHTGDINGDGTIEVLIGAPLDSTLGYQAGAIYIYSPELYRSSDTLRDLDAEWVIYGEGPDHKVGSSFALLNDRWRSSR